MTEFACIKNGMYSRGREVVRKFERDRRSVGAEFGRVVVWFKKRNVEHRMKTGKVGGKTKSVGKVGDSAVDGEGTEPPVLKFIRRARGLDVSSE